MTKALSKTLTFLIGALSVLVGGILFIIMSDLTFHNNSGSLIISTLLSFGGGFLFLLANSYADRPKVMYILKGVAVALVLGVIIYMHLYLHNDNYVAAIEKLRKAGKTSLGKYNAAKATVPVVLVFSYLSLVAQAANIVFISIFPEDDEAILARRAQFAKENATITGHSEAVAEEPAEETASLPETESAGSESAAE